MKRIAKTREIASGATMDIKMLSAKKRNIVGFILVSCSLLVSGLAHAEVECDSGLSCTQTITLNPGWNSVFVQVKPDQSSTAEIFAELVDGSGSQISSVWTFLSQRAKIDFIQDPNSENLLSQEGWLRYFPAQSSSAFLTNLYAIQANRAYLINLEGSSSVSLAITGTPVVPRFEWQSGAFNHIGFHVDPQNTPNFSDYLASSPAHNEQPVYQLIDNEWLKVDPLNTTIQSDVAYWVFSKTGSDYTGPIQVELPQLNRLEYGEVIEQFTARLKNKLNTPQSISVQVLGNAPGLHYPNPDAAATQSWLPLPSPLTIQVATEGESRIPLGIRRADFALSEFNHVLQITSAAGSRWLIPVTATAPALNSLWVGSVTIDGVSQVQNYKRTCIDTKVTTLYQTYDVDGQSITLESEDFEPNLTTESTGFDLCRDAQGFPIADSGETVTPVKKGGEFSFRVIVHREGAQVRLLKDVIQMYDATQDRYVLLTDDTLIPNYDGVTLRDGEAVGRRISSMAYDFPGNSHDMTGALDGRLEAVLVMEKDAPTNPFRHHYHNDHKNKEVPDVNDVNKVVVIGGGYKITRQMTFINVDAATLSPGLQVSPLSSGREVIHGNYVEVISGLHKTPIILHGTYTLRHTVAVNTLNQ